MFLGWILQRQTLTWMFPWKWFIRKSSQKIMGGEWRSGAGNEGTQMRFWKFSWELCFKCSGISWARTGTPTSELSWPTAGKVENLYLHACQSSVKGCPQEHKFPRTSCSPSSTQLKLTRAVWRQPFNKAMEVMVIGEKAHRAGSFLDERMVKGMGYGPSTKHVLQ